MTINVQDILSALFEPAETVWFRIFDDKKRRVFPGAKISCEGAKYRSIEKELKEYNSLGYGIFLVINYGGNDDKSITRINAQFVEMDNDSFDVQQQKLVNFPLKPSMVIKTQKSFHAYWFMDSNAEVNRFRYIQQQLVEYFDGDQMCVNESRVMRMPGFNHCKLDTPVMVKCVSFHPERRYSQEQLSTVLPTIEDKPVPKMSGSEKGLDIVMRSCDFLQHCKTDAATLSEPEWYAMITNLAVFEKGADLIHELSSPYLGYDYSATQKKINHFLSSGTKPIKCETIHEKCFKCPKYKSGDCGVKSPAALCYKPVSDEVLVDIISDLPVTGTAIKDIKTAEEFALNYLYNQDIVIADVIINSELRDHFKLKASYLKSLMQVYKNCSREYSKKSAAKAVNEELFLPDWYEPTEHGGLKFLPGILSKYLSEKENVIYAAEQYYSYQNGVYEEISEMEAQMMVKSKMIERETKMAQITDAEKQWRLLIRRDIRELNSNPYLINLRNGLYNIFEDSLEPHTPDYYSTVQLNVNYDKNADCPLFKKFLSDSMNGDMDQVSLIQEMLGYFLIPINVAQKCFVIVGAAGAGKSVLLRVLNDVLLGKKNVSNVSWQALNERFKTAELFGRLANIFADLPTKNIDDNGIFKALVGEDYLTVEKKNKDPFSFQSTARLLFSCNSIPRNYGDKSEGFYRRLIIIRFDHTVPAEERDPELLEKFRAEADGIFLFALEGLYRLMENQYKFSETQVNADELQKYREDSDSVLSFVKDCCRIDPKEKESSSDLYLEYKQYCIDSGLKNYSQKAFVQQLLALFPQITRDINRREKRRTLVGISASDFLD